MTSGASVVGRIGELVHPTRGADGPGEVRVSISGGTEIYLAHSAGPLPSGTKVLIVEWRGARAVDVVPWTDLPGTG
ncbi:hypothetical protein FPZ12_034970 [Amycolatopsis acidicola]|uniref:Uncharacterized protein n=1 Tax=Amycolatopsis acidicola TaxID=2596893 RepID=A0A5N0UTH8_9PSEU|nr:hypothetical protein [Amycolatopsis acidicola]KAA9153249.1 hypothetical protein FPZ12_034970 [Amycolatopsis acidicola]